MDDWAIQQLLGYAESKACFLKEVLKDRKNTMTQKLVYVLCPD